MSERLTDSQITEGLRLAGEATPGPWDAGSEREELTHVVFSRSSVDGLAERVIGEAQSWDRAQNAALIAHAGTHYAAALAEVQALRGQVEWIPVADRLPTVGRAVLATFRNELGNVRVVRALYTDGREAVLEDEDGEPCPAGWYENNEYEETHWRISTEVAFWLPLPASPLPPEVSR